jgi:hypothetical protein
MNDPVSHSPSDDVVVDAYLRHHTAKDDSLFWAWEKLEGYVRTDPTRAWNMTLQLIAAAATAEAVAYVAAGPLEDLLYLHGEQFIDEAERLARQDAKFRQALGGVWNKSQAPGDVHDRVTKAAAATSNNRMERARE